MTIPGTILMTSKVLIMGKRQSKKKSRLYIALIPLALLGIFIGFSWIRTIKPNLSPEAEALNANAEKAKERVEKSKYKTEVEKITKARAITLAGNNPSQYLLKGLATAGRARNLSFQADSPEDWAEVEKLWLDAYSLVDSIPYDHPDGDKAAAMTEDFFNLAYEASKKHP